MSDPSTSVADRSRLPGPSLNEPQPVVTPTRLTRARLTDFALAVIILVTICLPRGFELDRIVTPDEPLWLARSANFYQALVDGNLDATYQFVHPGVTVMWAGAIGFIWQYPDYPDDAGRQVEWRGTELSDILTAHGQDPLDLLVSLRLVLIVFSAIVLTAAFLCAMRLFGRWIAFAGFLLIALDPFHIALARLLHIDGLSTNLLLLSVLSFLNHTAHRRRSDLIVSGVAAGLAWLTRSANLILGPFLVLMVALELLPVWRHHRAHFGQAFRDWARAIGIWTGTGLLTFVALWPAIWTSPIRTLDAMFSGTIELASEAHERQIFFAGDVLSVDPGWHFYPVVAVWRISPVVLIGLFLALTAALLPRSFGQYLPRRPLCQIAIFAATYALILTAGDKKLDRYLLPSLASLDLIAGAGWIAAALWLIHAMRRTGHTNRLRCLAPAMLLTAALLGAGATAASARPYFIDYYNPLLGGTKGARDAMMVGWGEGMDLVANELLKQPDIEDAHVTIGPWHQSLEYFVPAAAERSQYEINEKFVQQWAWTDYWVVTYPEVQRQLLNPRFLAYLRSLRPVATIELNGFEYAWIYDVRTTPLPDFITEDDLSTDD